MLKTTQNAHFNELKGMCETLHYRIEGYKSMIAVDPFEVACHFLHRPWKQNDWGSDLRTLSESASRANEACLDQRRCEQILNGLVTCLCRFVRKCSQHPWFSRSLSLGLWCALFASSGAPDFRVMQFSWIQQRFKGWAVVLTCPQLVPAYPLQLMKAVFTHSLLPTEKDLWIVCE